jgi:hypothetical protein
MSAFEARPPYPSYAAILGLYAAGLAGAGALSRALDRDPGAAANDFLQAGFAALTAKANELEVD